MDKSETNEAAQAFMALLAASMTDLDEASFARMAGSVITEGGADRRLWLIGFGVSLAKDLMCNLAQATGRTEEEVLQSYAARWAG